MNARYLPPLLAAAALVASYAIWLPVDTKPPEPPPMPAPLLPTAADLPELPNEPDNIPVLHSARREQSKGPIAITRTAAKADDSAKQYRLRAYIGGNGLWVVTLEDDAGKYCTIRNGELIPHTHLEFRGMEFHPSSNGLPEGTAVFFDKSSSNYVDVVACESGSVAPAGNSNNGSVQ
jgi:hypothetical protein